MGRQRLRADLKKIVAHEFWPFWLFYAPLVPWLLWLSIRYRPMSFACANPGIAGGGGIVGESKSEICRSFSQGDVAHFVMIDAGGSSKERANRTIAMIRDDEKLSGYPVILKPDASERGFGVRLARTEDDVRAYFEDVAGTVQAQAYYPGPVEIGVLWVRTTNPSESMDDAPGEIFSITRKTFPEVVGDGESTIEELIWHHSRYRCQADVFLERFAGRTDEIIPEGERFSLGKAGNHAMGAMFTDGSDLLTDELADAFERIAQGFCHPETGGRLDFGRFDVRAESEDDLRAGRNFAIIELNGVLSESTNLYDPNRSIFWCYRVLFRQWARVYRLGAMRRREGARPMGIGELVRTIREHRRAMRGAGRSD